MVTPRVLSPTMARFLRFRFLSMISVAIRARTRRILVASMILALVFSSIGSLLDPAVPFLEHA